MAINKLQCGRFMMAVMIVLITASCDNGDPGLSTLERLNRDLATIDEYLANNAIEAYSDKRGIRFTITEMGTGGLPPRVDQTVNVTYTGWILATGEIFDVRATEGVLSNYIEGWQYALAIMPKGTKATLYIPSVLAYGESGRGTIPPDANLIFDIELTDVQLSTSQQQRLVQDIQTIDDYLSGNSISAMEDTTGLRYTIETEGAGTIPSWYSKVKIEYTGYVLGSSSSFYSGTSAPDESFDSRVVDYIQGFMVALQKLPVGSKAIIYVPSGLGFGAQSAGNGAVPAYSNLKYEIELKELVE